MPDRTEGNQVSEFLEIVRARWGDATKRLQSATLRLQQAQAEHQAAAQEAHSWQTILQSEERREAAQRVATANPLGTEPPAGNTIQQQPSAQTPPTVPLSVVSNAPAESDLNKSELIRQALRSHPGGLKPAEVWHKLKDQIPNRSYIYSVLGRLKERDQVLIKRGKYTLRIVTPKGEEGKEHLPIQ